MPQRGTLSAETVIAVIVFALAGAMLIAGLASVSIAGSTTTRTGYGAGLTMIVMSAVMCVGAGALLYHRKNLDANARVAEAIAQLAAAFTRYQREEKEATARIEREIREMRCEIRLLMAAQAQKDELAKRRNSIG